MANTSKSGMDDLKQLTYNQKLADALKEMHSFLQKNKIITLGPDGSNLQKMRFYAYGGLMAYFPTNQKSNGQFSTFDPGYIKYTKKESLAKCVKGANDKELKKLLPEEVKQVQGLQFDDFIMACNTEKVQTYLTFAAECAAERWNANQNTQEANKERDAATRLIQTMMGRDASKGSIIIDMEFKMPKIERKRDNGKIKHESKPDFVIFDGQSFGLVEFKYKGASMAANSEKSLREHLQDFTHVLVEMDDAYRWNMIEQCLRRMKYLMTAGLIDSSWEDAWNTVYDKYVAGKDGAFDQTLFWCGFLFADQVAGEKENYVNQQVALQLADVIKKYDGKVPMKYEYGALNQITLSFDKDLKEIMPGYRYLLWDVDGTVMDFLAAEKAAIRALFQKFGFGECTDEMLAQYSAINVKYWEMLERGELTKAEILVGRFEEFFGLQGLPVNKAADFNKEYQSALGDTVAFCDAADQILMEKKPSYILAAITNGTKKAQDKKLKNSGLDQVFDDIFISENVGCEKPGRAFFETVIETLGIQDLRQALIIGDSLTSDIKGGNIMGIDTCWYNPKGKVNTSDVIPTYEIKNLHELDKILKAKVMEAD